MASKAAPKSNKKPVSKDQAGRVAQFMKKKDTMGPKMPTPKDNPVTTYDDNDADD